MTKIGGIAIHLHKGGWKIWKIGPMISWPDGVPMQDGEAPVDGDPEGVIVIVKAGEIVPVVVLGGPDLAHAAPAFERAGDHVISAIGKTTLGETAALIRRARLFVGNDSGLLHVAMAFRVPAVALFGATRPELVLVPGSPCVALARVPLGADWYTHQVVYEMGAHHQEALLAISVGDVLDAVIRTWRGTDGAVAAGDGTHADRDRCSFPV